MPLLSSCLMLQLPFQTPSNLTWSHYLYSLPQYFISTSSHIFLLLFWALATLELLLLTCVWMPLKAWRLSHSNMFVQNFCKFAAIFELHVLQDRSTRYQPNPSPLGIPAVGDTCCVVISYSTRRYLLFWYNMRFPGFPCLSRFVFLDWLHYFLPVCYLKFVKCIWRITEAVC